MKMSMILKPRVSLFWLASVVAFGGRYGIIAIQAEGESNNEISSDLYDIVINGHLRACKIDHCILICDGDEAVLDICKHFQVSHSNNECKVDGCELKCNDIAIANICSIDVKEGNRKLGVAGLESVITSKNEISLWPEAIVYYQISEDVNETIIRTSIEHWEKNTEIQFHECHVCNDDNVTISVTESSSNENSTNANDKINVTNSSTNSSEPIYNTSVHICCKDCDYIKFISGSSCWSYVGRKVGSFKYGGQLLSVGPGCEKGNAIHEIGHALGMLHEHVRSDRDKYVRVFEHNIKENALANFIKMNTSTTLGPYDYDSIMHYGVFSFSKNRRGTMFPLDENGHLNPTIRIGQRDGLSKGDIKSIHHLYENEILLRVARTH